jgi:hypothetical protein
MISWASVAKRNIQSQSNIQSQPSKQPQVPSVQSMPQVPSPFGIIDQTIDQKQQALNRLAREEQSQCRPTNIYMTHPDAPIVCPTFKTMEERHQWMRQQEIQNSKYSDEVFDRRMLEWRTKNNWLLPPMKTAVSKEEQLRGFYVVNEGHEGKCVVKYVTPHSTTRDLGYEGMVNMMWCLIHSRADELVACKTVGEFEALFNQTIGLEYTVYNVSSYYGVRRVVNARKLLWLFSQKANVFPGKARHGTARWTVDPANQFPAPVFDPKVYTNSMVFFNLRDCRGTTISTNEREVRTTTPVFVVGAPGGRDETGICVVERLAQFGDKAKIRWLLSAAQLRKMERVVFSPEYCPFRESLGSDSDCYYDDEIVYDWL